MYQPLQCDDFTLFFWQKRETVNDATIILKSMKMLFYEK